MISFSSKGSSDNLERYLKRMSKFSARQILERHARAGVAALASATPVEEGVAARSWGYKIEESSKGFKIIWTNSDVENGFPVAIMLQHGYATGTGGYVQGRDYINPAIRPIMDRLATDVWREVTRG